VLGVLHEYENTCHALLSAALIVPLFAIESTNNSSSKWERPTPRSVPAWLILMKAHLDNAIELDPSFDEAHFALAVWCLQAPELAAKSIEKVKEILAALDRMNSPLGEVLRNRLAGRDGGRS
jgi:hypothetical protein